MEKSRQPTLFAEPVEGSLHKKLRGVSHHYSKAHYSIPRKIDLQSVLFSRGSMLYDYSGALTLLGAGEQLSKIQNGKNNIVA